MKYALPKEVDERVQKNLQQILASKKMDLQLQRKFYTEHSTIGSLFVDGKFECFTLEDTVRKPGVKIKGQTAIPFGKYEIVIDQSQRFGKPMPHILNVPNFEGIRIHPGNTDKDTEGCILIGQTHGIDIVGKSLAAFLYFFSKLKAGLEQGKVFIEIIDGDTLLEANPS